MVEIKTWKYDQTRHRDLAHIVGTTDFNAKAYRSCETAAKAFHESLVDFCKTKVTSDHRRFPILSSPDQSLARGYGKNWTVMWEDGPFEWAIFLCMDDEMNGSWGYCEPQNSFTICFVEL